MQSKCARDGSKGKEGDDTGAERPWHAQWTEPIDLTDVFFSGIIDEEVIDTPAMNTDTFLDVVYGDTDSIMFATPFEVVKDMAPEQVVRFSSLLSRLVCAICNTYLKNLELLQDEKISRLMLLPGMKKNYIMILVTGDTLLSGIEGKKRDAHPLVQLLTKDVVTPMMMDTSVPLDQLGAQLEKMIARTKEILGGLVRNKIPHSQMVLSEKLNRAEYKHPKEITVVRDRRLSRSEQVNVGERITYVLTDLDARDPEQRQEILRREGRRKKGQRNVDMVECARYAAEHAVPINYEETFHRKIAAPILKLYRPFIVPVTDFPNAEHLLREGIAPDSKQGKKLLEKRRNVVFDYQNEIARPLIFGELLNEFEKRRRIKYREVRYEEDERDRAERDSQTPKKRQRGLMSFFTQVQGRSRIRERVCMSCNTTFNGEGDMCPTCLSRRDQITQELYEKCKTDEAELEKAYARCHVCVADTGFPEIDIRECTDFTCPVYEKRTALKFDVKAQRGKVKRFQSAGACPGVVFDW